MRRWKLYPSSKLPTLHTLRCCSLLRPRHILETICFERRMCCVWSWHIWSGEWIGMRIMSRRKILYSIRLGMCRLSCWYMVHPRLCFLCQCSSGSISFKHRSFDIMPGKFLLPERLSSALYHMRRWNLRISTLHLHFKRCVLHVPCRDIQHRQFDLARCLSR
jgi:hypothetical protein